ncbi:DNA topoisomerase I [Candidatus Woesearchaeota archaeon]|nr:DNA topoisomerase I [Candidatus Woesearchaeota archaeon]|tara:strand:+ start:4494 stop:6677 length:2184 start_codon:yes stop_codon:yes gene_type:complete
MSYTLIITEKPKSAQKIAEALADGKPIKKGAKGVYYYEITHGDKDIIVGSSVGHLFGIAEKTKKGMKYPVFDVEWQPLYEINKGAAFSKKYYDMLKKLSKNADVFVISTDFDVEGSVIGMNIIRFICKQKDAYRMKFSTLTKPELINAFENASPNLDWGQAVAGETRHQLDFIYGVNLSRALTSSIKKAGLFKILSIGRVQGPTLKIVVEKEKEISAFKPVPFWQLEITGNVKNGVITALHKTDKFWKKDEAGKIYKKVKGKNGEVSEVKKQEFQQKAPTPFDLTTLQTEAYRCFGISPKITLSVAQDLYTSGLISYPRTSSQQLPPAIEYEKILKQLQKNSDYKDLCSELLKKKLQPNNGKKTDPAHPAIYPTGVSGKALKELNQKIYDIIARRFMATFAEAAIRETMTITIEVEEENFVSAGTRTKYEGWHKYYGPYVKLKEEELPEVKKGESFKQKKLDLQEKETKPPARYTPASIIKELEKRNLGTKATRAEVIDTLYRRDYVVDKALTATDLGIKTVETLEKYVPRVVDEELTKHFEEEMEEIRQKKKEEEVVLKEAENLLTEILGKFKKKEMDIGKNLFEATKASEEKLNTIGKCMSCEGILMMKRGKFGKFIACSKYPDCKVTFKLPSNGLIKNTEEICDDCKHPKIMVIKKRKKPQIVCINLDCPTKVIESDKENTKCEKCKEGTIVIRKSVYGQFLACDNFPKCRNILKTEKKDDDKS